MRILVLTPIAAFLAAVPPVCLATPNIFLASPPLADPESACGHRIVIGEQS